MLQQLTQQTKMTKKMKSTRDSQRKELERLLKNPDKEIVIPERPVLKRTLSPPPEIVSNVPSSSAGAGSGEFHVYKAARRKEFERIKIFEEEAREEASHKEFEQKQQELSKKDEERTNKNRQRRQKRKQQQAKKKQETKEPTSTEKTDKELTTIKSDGSESKNDMESKDQKTELVDDQSQNESKPIAESTGLTIIDDDDGF